jgi:hypothetical protein
MSIQIHLYCACSLLVVSLSNCINREHTCWCLCGDGWPTEDFCPLVAGNGPHPALADEFDKFKTEVYE